nr:hypothetical protein [Candidatus Njordarchaeum guaymaensis]
MLIEPTLLVLLGLIVGLYVTARIAENIQQRQGQAGANPNLKPIVERVPPIPIRPQPQRTLPEHLINRRSPAGFTYRPAHQPASVLTETMPVKEWIEKWRESVVLLIKWGERNISDARVRLEVGDYRSALDTAVTGVERMSRALLHCLRRKARHRIRSR